MKIGKFKIERVLPDFSFEIDACELLILNPSELKEDSHNQIAFVKISQNGNPHFDYYSKVTVIDDLTYEFTRLGGDVDFRFDVRVKASFQGETCDQDTTDIFMKAILKDLEFGSIAKRKSYINYFICDFMKKFSRCDITHEDVNSIISQPKLNPLWNEYVVSGVRNMFHSADFSTLKFTNWDLSEYIHPTEESMIQAMMNTIVNYTWCSSRMFPKLWKLYGAIGGMSKKYLDIQYEKCNNRFSCGDECCKIYSRLPDYNVFGCELL